MRISDWSSDVCSSDLDPEEAEAVKLESKKTLELIQFVDAHDIDVLYYEKPYYVVPADDLAEEAFIVLRDALRKTRKEIGRAHVCTPVTNAQLVCRLLLETKNEQHKLHTTTKTH